MERHYTYLDSLFSLNGGGVDPQHAADYPKLLFAVMIAGLLVILGKMFISNVAARRSLSADGVVPDKRLGLFGLADLLMECYVGYHDSVAGVENRRFVPFTASIFFFIFGLNLLGLVPGMPASTTTVWLNVAMATVVFIHFNYHGIKEHGLWGYLKHFMGPLWWLAPLIFVIEIMSISMRIITLNLRLYWNITADHLVLGVFSNMLADIAPLSIPIGAIMASPFYILGLFVSFMQAFVFTTLTMIYIVLATQHEEGH